MSRISRPQDMATQKRVMALNLILSVKEINQCVTAGSDNGPRIRFSYSTNELMLKNISKLAAAIISETRNSVKLYILQELVTFQPFYCYANGEKFVVALNICKGSPIKSNYSIQEIILQKQNQSETMKTIQTEMRELLKS